MGRCHAIMREVPQGGIELPGVKECPQGWRVPLNAYSVLGLTPPTLRSTVEMARTVYGEAPFRPGVMEMVADHQLRMLAGAMGLSGFHGWAPPGAGKTLVGLGLLAHRGNARRLVITKAGARSTWADQTQRYTSLRPILLRGTSPMPVRPDAGVLYITAWETLKYWRKELCAFSPEVVVYDETHWLRAGKRYKPIVGPDGRTRFKDLDNTFSAACEVARRSDWHLSLTATPIPGRVIDLWPQLELCEPYQWGGRHAFGVRYAGGTQNSYGWEYKGLSNAEELRSRLVFIRERVSDTEVNKLLPPKRREVIRLEVSDQSRPAAFKRDMKQAQAQGGESMFETMLMEAASRKHKYIEGRVRTALTSKQKVVIFTGRRKECETLGKKLVKVAEGLGAQGWWGHGGSSHAERDEMRKAYMAHPGPCILIGTGHAWGESIDLQDTDLALIAMLPFTPEKLRQWEGRFTRLGQTRPVLLTYIVARTTVDEHVADIVLDKLPHVAQVGEDAEATAIQEALSGIDWSEAGRKALLARLSGHSGGALPAST